MALADLNLEQLQGMTWGFRADLASMDDEELVNEADDAQEVIDRETSWVEAICAEQEIRRRASGAIPADVQ